MQDIDIKSNNRFREGRTRAGVSVAEAADSFGTSRGTVRRWEQGKTLPSLTMLGRMARRYSASADWLIGATEE